MTSEPTNGELERRLQDIQRMLSAVVGVPEYAADKRASDFRQSEVERDLAEERRERSAAISQERADRAEAIREVSQRMTEQAKAGLEHRMHWRGLLLTGVLPAVVALLGILVTLWISHHGGGAR